MPLVIIAALFFLVAMPIMTIVALVKALDAQRSAANLESKNRALHSMLQDHLLEHRKSTEPKPEQKATITPEVPDVVPVPQAPPKPRPAPASSPAVSKVIVPPSPPPIPRKKKNLEEALGGKVAGLIGVMILVAGIAFLVGSPGIIWPSPLFKVLMGLGFGGVLLGCGHVAERNKSGKFVQLARTMTGGGGGLFYFCIFAAYSLYGICSPIVTAAGLTASAALLLYLSLLYNSQLVATLSILGAFITPVLTGGAIDQGAFPLAYIALINLPVMFLGIKKNWQVLYNSAYVFTVLYFAYWMFNLATPGWGLPLSAALIYFLEFSTLSLLILRTNDDSEKVEINIIRIIASGLLMSAGLYAIFYNAGIESRLGIGFAGLSVLYAAFGWLAWKWKSAFEHETLGFILCGFAAIALCILETANGTYQGILWLVQSLTIAWLFRKPAPTGIQLAAASLGGIGGMASIVMLVNDNVAEPAWFNLESLLALIGAFLLGLCCRILRNGRSSDHIVHKFSTGLLFGSFALILVTALRDIAEFDSQNVLPWLIASIVFAGTALLYRRRQPHAQDAILHFTLLALASIAFYLHMQLAGLWISLAWGILGMLTSILAFRARSPAIQNGGILIGFAALIHATIQPIQTTAPILMNPHTLCGLFTALALGFQARLRGQLDDSDEQTPITRLLWMACIGAVLAITYRNIFTTLSPDVPLPWLLTTLITLFIGNLVNWMLGKDVLLQQTGRFLVAAIPVKLLLDIFVPWDFNQIAPSLASITLWIQVAVLIIILWFARRIKECPKPLANYFALAPLISGIALISFAIGATGSEWSRAIVSLWWGIAALALTMFGFSRKSRLHRHVALLLFGATILKVLFIDCSAFQAGARVMIFIGVGLLLLILSFIYQKVSERLL